MWWVIFSTHKCTVCIYAYSHPAEWLEWTECWLIVGHVRRKWSWTGTDESTSMEWGKGERCCHVLWRGEGNSCHENTSSPFHYTWQGLFLVWESGHSHTAKLPSIQDSGGLEGRLLHAKYVGPWDLGTLLRGSNPRDLGTLLSGSNPRDLGTLLRGSNPRDLGTLLRGSNPRDLGTLLRGSNSWDLGTS